MLPYVLLLTTSTTKVFYTMSKKSNVANKPGQDPTLPKVELVVNGTTYFLAYDFNAICRADEATGINLLDSVLGKVTATSLRGLLWAALLKAQPEMTLEDAGSLISVRDNVQTIREAITTAWFGSVTPEDGSSGEDKETQD